MKIEVDSPAAEVRARLVELGGRTSQDLGLGRIPGQMLLYLYLQEEECSLDRLCADLGLSKAAVSTAARQLESLGLLRQVWRRGDRRNYYRTADNLGQALQQGIMSLVRRKVEGAASEMDQIDALLDQGLREQRGDRDLAFLRGRLRRAMTLRDRVARLLGSRLLRLLVR